MAKTSKYINLDQELINITWIERSNDPYLNWVTNRSIFVKNDHVQDILLYATAVGFFCFSDDERYIVTIKIESWFEQHFFVCTLTHTKYTWIKFEFLLHIYRTVQILMVGVSKRGFIY